MHKKFDSAAIEKKWQKEWESAGIYTLGERDHSKEKEYVLVEWPYPSGNLHIGHWYAFAVPDIYVRYRRMNGVQVLYPMGFDAFGLPAENAAIKRNLDPKAWTNENIAYMRNQLSSMGNAFSWDKTTNSTDPEYYKWTQWMFTEFFKHDIAYRGKGIVNWCPGCNTVIANEQVLGDGTCERSGDVIEKREMPQWMLAITKYANQLIDDLDTLAWPDHIKEAQRQWIGRSKGAEIDFKLSVCETVTVFTTRPDTLYGATFLVLAPEHPLVIKYKDTITNWVDVSAYIDITKQKDEQDRLDNTKEKTGVKLEGITAVNPASGEVIPVFIADYVLGGYGTGAIMAVPAHDERDNAFAKKFDLPIKQVVSTFSNATGENTPRSEENIIRFRAATVLLQHWSENKFFVVEFSSDSHGFIGGHVEDDENITQTAIRETIEESGYNDFEYISLLQEWKFGRGYKKRKSREELCEDSLHLIKLKSDSRGAVIDSEIKNGFWLTAEEILKSSTVINWHKDFLRSFLNNEIYSGAGVLVNSGEFDGLDSEKAKAVIISKVGGRMTNTYRLRDWSIGRQRYWGVPIPIVYDPEGKAHPVPKEHLPWLLPEDVDFRPTGEAPLAKSEALRKRTEEIFGAGWTPEVETMDTFVDSSWYYLRYLDNHNEEGLTSLKKQEDWMPIDIYFGGAEHTTMHLLYSRFWQKALLDLGLVTESEPYKRRINRGLILGPDGNKMSKSKGNVIDPDEHVRTVGADTVKMYLAFMGPYEGSNYPFDLGGIAGVRRFLERVYGLSDHLTTTDVDQTKRLLHKTIAKVRADIETFKFNTAISAMMIFVNQAEKSGLSKADYELFLRVLAPFAPHLCEEIWSSLGHTASIHLESFPLADPKLLTTDTVTLSVQVNGKMRGTITVAPSEEESVVRDAAMENKDIMRHLAGKTVSKVIYVPGRILNLLTNDS